MAAAKIHRSCGILLAGGTENDRTVSRDPEDGMQVEGCKVTEGDTTIDEWAMGADRKLGWQGKDGRSYEAGMRVGPWQSRANHRPERELLAPIRAASTFAIASPCRLVRNVTSSQRL